MLTGACISRASGFPAKARYATAACVVAAEFPDIDYVYRLGGPLVYFQHHRGWTHALWSLPLQAALIAGIFWGIHRTRHTWKKRRSREEPAPVQWPLLFLMALLALCSHILLDWTNNYGVRPFAPWNTRWFEGDLIYIVEPLMYLLLGGALLLPWLFSLVHREIGVRRAKYPGRGMAIAALVGVIALWAYRGMEHADAARTLQAQEFRGGAVLRSTLSPYPITPYRWFAIVETPLNFQTGTVDTRTGLFETDPQQIIPKPPETAAVMAAKRSWLGRVYLDWSRYPVVAEVGSAGEAHPEMELKGDEAALRAVRFRDLRFGYDPLGRRSTGSAMATRALGAEAWVHDGRDVTRVEIGGAEQKIR